MLWMWVLMAACAGPPALTGSPDQRIWRDLAYDGGDPKLSTYDLFVPSGQPQGLVVFVHGGSWVGGDKGNLAKAPSFVPWLTGHGWAVAAPNFRLASRLGGPLAVDWRDQCTDLDAAVRSASERVGSEVPVVLIGYSSGAHLVALLAAHPDFGVEGRFSAVVSLDVHAYDVGLALEQMVGSDVEKNIPLIRHLFGSSIEEASPAHHIARRDMPPSLVVSAEPSGSPTSKGRVARTTSETYVERLVAAGHRARHVHYDQESHSSLVLDLGSPGDGPTAEIENWLGLGR